MNILRCGRFRLELTRPLIMGVVNVTPDSFSDGGRYASRDAAVAHAERLVAEGADLLDIGGESSRPGADPVAVAAELDRVLPVVEAVAALGVPVSVDTVKPEVMRAAIGAGAAMINDINALRAPGAVEALAPAGVGVCLMHMQGEPRTMQQDPHYQDVVAEVMAFLAGRVAALAAAGVGRDRVVVDPGFGFGKTFEHNLALLGRLPAFRALGVPLLAGMSRKSMLGKITGRETGGRLHASVAAAMWAAEHGAAIVRVHDVAATRDALAVLAAASPRA
ncbi:MAG: dihydropteroate synthase [Pseudomonadota bacterium]